MTKRKIFAAEYIVDLNATKAAERAGYSVKSAHAQGCRLLRDAEVRAEIDKLMERRGRKLEITAASVLAELAKLAFFDPRDLFRADGTLKAIDELDGVTAAGVAGFEVREYVHGKDGSGTRTSSTLRKIRLVDKGSNLDRLARHLKLYGDLPAEEGMNPELLALIAAIQGGPNEGTSNDLNPHPAPKG